MNMFHRTGMGLLVAAADVRCQLCEMKALSAARVAGSVHPFPYALRYRLPTEAGDPSHRASLAPLNLRTDSLL